MLALIGGIAKGAGAARSASKLLPSRSVNKKGGALVPQQRPRLTQFTGEAEKRKEEARPSLNKSAFFRAPTIGEPKKGATKMKTVENKVSKISEFFAKTNKKKKEAFNSFLKRQKEEDRKEREEKRENFAKGLGKGIKNKALAPIKSIFDKILNAVGQLILGKIAMWAIDNPKAFVAIVQGIEKIVTISTDIFIGTVDFLGTIIKEGYKLVDGFNDWSKDNLGEDATNTLNDIGPKIAALLGGVLLLGKAMEGQALSELGRKDPTTPGSGRGGGSQNTKPTKPDKPGKPGKLGGGTEKTLSGRTRSTATVKPQRSPIQQTRIGSPERRLARNVQVKHGHAVREFYEEAYDEALGKGKSPFEANKTAKTKVDRLVRKNPQISKPQLGTLSTRANRIRGTVGGPGASNLIGSKVFGKGVDRATQRFFLKIIGKGGVTAVKKAMGKIPIIGPLLVFGLNWASGESIARSASMAIGAGLGQMLGTWAGTALGAFGGPFAPITLPLGGFVGAMLGGIGGEFLGGLFYDAITGKLGSSPGAVGSALGGMIGELFTEQIPEMLKGFTEWFTNTMKALGTGFLNIINASAKFLGLSNLADVFKNTVGKAFSAIGNFFKMIQEVGFPPLNPLAFGAWVMGNLGKLKDGLFSLFGGMKDFAMMLINPIGFIFNNAIMPFFKNLGEMWANRDKLFDFLTRENTFSEVTGAISSLGQSASSSISATTGALPGRTATSGAAQPQTAMITKLGSGGGSLKGMTDQDYSDLAFIVSYEAARGTEDEYGVAAAVLNRVADPRYPNTIMGVGTAPGQFEAVFKGLAKRDPALAKKLQSNNGKIIAALKKLNGRTDFKGQTMLKFMGAGDVMFDPKGNFFHYAEQQAKSDPPPANPPEHWKKLLGEGIGKFGDGSTTTQQRITPPASPAPAPYTPPAPSPAVMSSSNPPSSPAASAVPTLGDSSVSQSSAVPQGTQGMTPLPIPINRSNMDHRPGSPAFNGAVDPGFSLNRYYRAQLFAFLYKQG